LAATAEPQKGTWVKVATFNINNINKRLDNLLAWLAKAEPDVVSLQELKAEQEAFPVNALRTLGYEAVWQGERSWNGVAILARNIERNNVPVLTRTSLPGILKGVFLNIVILEISIPQIIKLATLKRRFKES
jgi:exonuclease III